MKAATAIRPPDESVSGTTLAYMAIKPAEAVRRILELAYRDCWSCLDLTYGSGCFWRGPRPPGLQLTSNNLDPSSSADLHRDFTATGLPDRSYDLVVYDPPHLADGGKRSIMAARFGTVKTTAQLQAQAEAGAREALRLARLGMLVKVTNSCHGSEYLPLSQWVQESIGLRPYFALHTFRPCSLEDPKWKAQRVPRSNGAVYLAFRLDSYKHRDFERLYARQLACGGGPHAQLVAV